MSKLWDKIYGTFHDYEVTISFEYGKDKKFNVREGNGRAAILEVLQKNTFRRDILQIMVMMK